jgi:hypothetical protein
MDLNRSEAKVTTLEEFNRHSGGKPPNDNDSLWQIFNDKVSDLTHHMRKNAREIVRKELFSLEKRKQVTPLSEQASIEIANSEYEFANEFTEIVKGGFKGAYVAGKVLVRNYF